MFNRFRKESPSTLQSGDDSPTLSNDRNIMGYSASGDYGLKECHDVGDGLVDIVFVHGLTGNRETTWTNKKSGLFWPGALLKQDIPNARILTFGYDADIVRFWGMASQNCIGGHARNLLNALTQLRERTETGDRPILFIAHSLGGLVVEDAMLASKNSAEAHLQQLVEYTEGIAFLGTPHCGADLVHWAKIFGNFANIFKTTNNNLLSVLQPNSEVLARIQQEFHMMLSTRRDGRRNQLKITCFFEELPVRGVGEIVPKHSAILPSYNSIGIRANHMDMTKFDSDEDPGYSAVSTEAWRWVKAIQSRAPASQAAQDSQVAEAAPQQPDAQQQPMFEPGNRVFQGGNIIEGQTISGSGKTVQGINMRSDGNITLNF